MKIFIKRSQSFPSFHTVRNDLELEEIDLNNSAGQGQASVFYYAPSGGGRPPQQQLPPHPPQQEPLCPPVPPPPPTSPPTTVAKARVRARGRGKARTTSPATKTGATTPRRGPPSTIPGLTPSRFGQGCALLSSRRVHRSTPCLLHRHTMAPLAALPSRPCRLLHHTNCRSRPLPGHPGRACGIISHLATPSAPWS
jgi:hypothetical protein